MLQADNFGLAGCFSVGGDGVSHIAARHSVRQRRGADRSRFDHRKRFVVADGQSASMHNGRPLAEEGRRRAVSEKDRLRNTSASSWRPTSL